MRFAVGIPEWSWLPVIATEDDRMPKEVEPIPPPPPLVVAASRAFGTPLRLSLLHELDLKPNSARGLALLVGASEATVTQNLRLLADEGLIAPVDPDAPRRSRAPYLYELEPTRLAELLEALRNYTGAQRTRRRQRITNHTQQP